MEMLFFCAKGGGIAGRCGGLDGLLRKTDARTYDLWYNKNTPNQ